MLEADGVRTQPLNVSHAFHSSLLGSDARRVGARRRKHVLPAPIDSVRFQPHRRSLDDGSRREVLARPLPSAGAVLARHAVARRTRLRRAARSRPVAEPHLDGRRCIDSKRTTWIPSVRPNQDDAKSIAMAVAQASVGGAAIDWTSFDGGRKRRHVWLPTYSFDRERFWVDGLDRTADRAPPLPGRDHCSAAAPLPRCRPRSFSDACSLADHPFLRDHVVQGSVVRSRRGLSRSRPRRRRGGFRRRSARRWKTSFFRRRCSSTKPPSTRCRSSSRPKSPAEPPSKSSGSPTLRTARGRCMPPASSSRNAANPRRRRRSKSKRCARWRVETVRRDELYRRLRDRGLEYGPAFQGLSDAAKTPGRFAVAKLEIPDRVQKEAGKHVLHPAIGDLLLQLFGGDDSRRVHSTGNRRNVLAGRRALDAGLREPRDGNERRRDARN